MAVTMGKDQSVLRVDTHHEVAGKKGDMPTVRGMDREVRTVSLIKDYHSRPHIALPAIRSGMGA